MCLPISGQVQYIPRTTGDKGAFSMPGSDFEPPFIQDDPVLALHLHKGEVNAAIGRWSSRAEGRLGVIPREDGTLISG